jgi:hypothetical protein
MISSSPTPNGWRHAMQRTIGENKKWDTQESGKGAGSENGLSDLG